MNDLRAGDPQAAVAWAHEILDQIKRETGGAMAAQSGP